MSLGYVLLHPSRVELALKTTGTSLFLHEMTDSAFGAMAVGSDLATGFTEYCESRVRFLEDLLEQLRSWIEPSGPFGFFSRLGDDRANPPDIGAMLDQLTTSLASLPALKERVCDWLRSIVNLLPDSASASVSVYLREQFNAITEILESPLRNGRNDVSAHRGFRAAVTLRQVFGPYFEETLSAFAAIDIKSFLLRFIDDLCNKIRLPDLESFGAGFIDFSAKFSGLLRAFANLNASFSVSVSVSAGTQDTADPELTLDQKEQQAAPDPPGHWLWWLDLITGVFATFSSIWEMVRAANWKGREGDGVLNVISILWHATQTLMRAAFRDSINLKDPTNLAQRFGNWMFTDRGNMLVNLVCRWFGSIHDMTTGSASNWAQSFVPSMLKYYSTMVNFRTAYWTARSYRYFSKRRLDGITTAPLMPATLWGIWGPCVAVSSSFGLIPAWEDFSLELGLGKAQTIVPLVLALLLGPLAGGLSLGLVIRGSPFVPVAVDWPMLSLIAVAFTLGVIGVSIILGDTDSEIIGGVIIAFIIVAVFLGLGLIGIGIVFGIGNTGTPNAALLHIVMFPMTWLFACILPVFLWWFYIDDGRDKLGVFDGLDADTSPYRLPYPRGKNLMVSQGVHGIFSHYDKPEDDPDTDVSDNHYSYDFNDAPGQPALAARGGIVVSYEDQVPTSEPRLAGEADDEFTPNSINVQHMDWIAGHDPGTDLERVLTLGEYVHPPQNGVFTDTNQRIVQGYHLCNIDSTGRSAVNHLHFNVADNQNGEERTFPSVFVDSTLRRFRHFPLLLSWISGNGHIDGKPFSHAYFESETDEAGPVLNPIRIRTSAAAPNDHTHFVELDKRSLGTGALPGSVTLTTVGTEPGAGLSAVADHFHSITLSQADVVKLLGMGTPDAFATTAFDGHSHGFGSIERRRGSAPSPEITVEDAPRAHLQATNPGPYRFVGDQLVIRINGRATDYLLYGCHRPALLADVALDRGIPAGSIIRVDDADYTAPATPADRTVRGNARAFNPLLPGFTLRCLPTIVIETRQRGSSAALSVTFRGVSQVASGTGSFPNLADVSRTVLAGYIDGFLKNGWLAPPAGLTTTLNSAGELRVTVGATPVDFTPSSSRIAEVLTGLYRSSRVAAAGAIPLSTGRIAIAGFPDWAVPLLGTPAEVGIDTAATSLAGTSLVISAMGTTQSVPLDEGSPEAVARRIMLNAEGVRAWQDGQQVLVQTVAGGSSSSLELRIDGGAVLGSNTGATAAITGSAPPLDDTTAVVPQTLKAIFDDAVARDTPPPAAANPEALIDGDGRLVIQITSGAFTSAAAVFTGTGGSFALSQDSPQRVLGSPPETLTLTGPAWIDLAIDGSPVRIPIDGEAARIDLGVLDRMPAEDETLTLSVNTGAPQEVTFTGTEADLAEVAATIARASADITVRIAYTLSVENSLYGEPGHKLVLAPSTGLAAAGFLRDSDLQADVIALSGDALNVEELSTRYQERGVPVAAFSVTEMPSGTAMVWRLDARGGLQIRAAHTAVARPSDPDPLGFPTAAAPFIDTAVIPAALDIRAQCREYGFEVTDADNVIIARSYTQITANPAMVRSVIGPPVLPLPATTSALNITVTAPGVDDRTYQADLRGLSSLAEIAQRLNAITPDLRAWAIPGTPELLHLETAGAGTSWGLRLDSLPLLLALGFDRTDMDLAEGTLTVSGRGTVANSQAVTHAEIGAALNRAVLAITGSTAVRALQVANEDPDIALRSLEGPVTIETEPASLRTALNVVETPTRTTLTPGSTLNADNSSIIVKIAGATAAVAHIWGDYAIVRGNVSVTTLGPAAVTTMLDLLRNSQISLAVDGAAARMLPTVPAALATIEEAIEFLAGQAPEAWIGIDLNGSVLFHSRDAGDGRSLSLDFSGFATGGTYPAGTVLGFEAAQLDENFAIGASGRGTVSRLGSVSWREVLNLLRAAADEGASPQTIYTAEVDSAPTPAIVRLTTNVFNWSLQQRVLGTGPNSVVFAPPGTPPPAPDDEETPPGNVLETSFPPAQAIDPGVFELTAVVTYPPQTVRALVAAQPARLPPIQMPTTLAVLNGSGFDLDVQGLGFRVVFSANTATTAATLAAQIERQTFWFVRARITGGGLLLETTGKGSALSLTVSDPTGGAAPAITGNPATGMTASGPLPISASGAGPVTDMNTVTPNEFRAILERAYISQAGDEARYSTRELDFRAYEAVGTAPSFATIRSNRGGCISHLDTVIDLAPSLGLSRSFERAPALRAAVVLPAFDGQKTLSGTLHIQFNDNTGSADLDPPAVVSVTFPSDDYAPADVARLIHNEIFGRRFGQAGAYPDGTVVIETHVPGLAGTVRIPAPGTATSDPDQSLFRDLFGDTTERFERGWPGIGFGSVRHGLRSLPGNARGAAVWVFSAGPVSTAPIGVSTGASLAALRTQIDDALAAAPGGRIGLCALGTDGTLYVESGPVPLTLAIDGQPWAVRLRERPGETPELKEEPAVGFRLTHVPRTIRYARDRFGNLVESEFEDAQWVRLPAARDTGMPVGSLWFPSGFYWTAIRADASKTTDYDDTGRMIISGGVHPDDASRFFVHRARYWMGLDHWDGRENGGTLHIGQMLRIVRRSTGEFMLEVLWAVTP